jgi:hypothetical protein
MTSFLVTSFPGELVFSIPQQHLIKYHVLVGSTIFYVFASSTEQNSHSMTALNGNFLGLHQQHLIK